MATGKELEAEGSPIMDDRANDGRGAWMAFSAQGMEGGDEVRIVNLEVRSLKAERFSSLRDQAADEGDQRGQASLFGPWGK